jgi:hypothetical protein
MPRTAYDLHAAAQEAAERGMNEMAARLLMEAADVALTEGGRRVLLEQAVDAAARACAEAESHDERQATGDRQASATGYPQRAVSTGQPKSKRRRRERNKREVVTNLEEFVRRTAHPANGLVRDVFAGMPPERRKRGRSSTTVLSPSGPLISTTAADASRETLIFRRAERGRQGQAKR